MKTGRIIHIILLLVPLTIFFLTSGAYAEIKPGTINITPSIGYCQVDNGLHYDSGLAWGIGAGLNFSEELGCELNFNSVDSESGGHSGRIMMSRLDLLVHLSGLLSSNKTVPYVSLGTGFASFKSSGLESRKEYDLILDPGLGLKHYLSKNFALRGDGRYILDFTGHDLHHNLLFSAGLTFEFGSDEEKPVIIPPAPVEPAAPAQEEICPPGPDACTEKDWCRKDSDGDGVPDCIDKCPDTPKGTRVDAFGCPPVEDQGVIIFRNIQFDFNKSNLKPESHSILDEVVEYLNSNKTVKMEIQGHTDNRGTEQYNIKLSYKRADSVRKYLVSKGVSAERLKVSGFGFSKPVVPNDTEENRSRNRRVEFKPI